MHTSGNGNDREICLDHFSRTRKSNDLKKNQPTKGSKNMKKKLLKGTLFALVGIGLCAGPAFSDAINVRPVAVTVAPGAGDELDLQVILNTITEGPVLDVVNDQSAFALWTHTDIKATTALEVAYYTAGNGQLGLYDSLGNEFLFPTFINPNVGNPPLDLDFTTEWNSINFTISGGNLLAGGSFVEDGWSDSFGFFWLRDGNSVYTEDSKNGGNPEALSYLLEAGTPINLEGFGLGDFGVAGGNDDWILAFDNYGGPNDFNDAVMIVKDMQPVPEPATMLLFGAGLIGLAGVARKRKMRN